MYRRSRTWQWLVILASCTVASRAEDGITNPDFEQGGKGELPPGWVCPTGGFAATLTEDDPHGGSMCAHLAATGDAGNHAPFGNIMQTFDATPYRGKRIRMSAAVRTSASATGRAQMWVREDTAAGGMGFFNNMGDRPIRGTSWRTVEIVGNITADAARLNVGLMIFGDAEAWLDDVKVEVVGDVETATVEPPRALDERGLANVVAFAKLFGLVRHFHPSDGVASADWDSLAIEGVRSVETAKDAKELAARLTAFFAPIAPLVQAFETGAPTPTIEVPTSDAGELKLVRWEHQGFGTGAPMSIYRSSRSHGKFLSDGGVPEDFADPRKPFVVDLGGGVSCAVPLTVCADNDGTLPHTNAKSAAKSEFASEPTGNDRATRLADVILAWNIFEHFYPYFDVVETDWDRTLVDSLQRAATDKGEREFLDTLRLMVAALHDGHGRVGHASDRDYSIPPLAVEWIENSLVVTEIGDDAHGIAVGDVVKSIDGVPAADAIERAERLISGATPQWRRFRAVEEVLCGPMDSTVTLEIESADRARRKVALPRDVQFGGASPKRPAPIVEVKPGVMYVDIGRVSDADFKEALPQFEKATGIVFDFRGYPRNISPDSFFPHLIKETAHSPQWHVPRIRRPGERDYSERNGEWTLTPREPYLTAKRAFLTYGGAISYAESCLGIIEHYKLGEIVGGPTAGTNGNINPFTVPGGYSFVWTGMKVLKNDGSQHHGVGVLPTIPVSRTIEGVRAGRDEVLERGIEAVSR